MKDACSLVSARYESAGTQAKALCAIHADVFRIACTETGWHLLPDSCRSASSRRSQLAIWFQLAKVWLINRINTAFLGTHDLLCAATSLCHMSRGRAPL
jgi:hypothetical protein